MQMQNSFLHSDIFGYYYPNIRPFVFQIGVSLSDETYSLEGELTYNPSNKIGTFKGYPANFNDSGELVFGFGFSTGIILIDGIKTWSVDNGILAQFVPKPFIFNADSSSNVDGTHNKIMPECTPTLQLVDTNIVLGFESNFNKQLACGIFSGTPGECYYPEGSSSYDRVYGSQYANGTVTLNCLLDLKSHYQNLTNPKSSFEFKYILNKGKIQTIPINHYYYDQSFDLDFF